MCRIENISDRPREERTKLLETTTMTLLYMIQFLVCSLDFQMNSFGYISPQALSIKD